MAEKNDTYKKLITIITEVLRTEDLHTINPQSKLDDLGIDSLDRLEIIMKIEETFDIDISDEQEEKVIYIQDLVDVVHTARTQ